MKYPVISFDVSRFGVALVSLYIEAKSYVPV